MGGIGGYISGVDFCGDGFFFDDLASIVWSVCACRYPRMGISLGAETGFEGIETTIEAAMVRSRNTEQD